MKLETMHGVLTWGSSEANTNYKITSKLTQPQQNINAPTEDELNLQTGIAGRINEFCKCDDVRNGINQKAQAGKRKETANSHND